MTDPAPPRFTKAWFLDAAERVGGTFVESAAGSISASLLLVTTLDVSTEKKIGLVALTTGLSAAFAAVKTIAAAFRGGSSSPAGLIALPDSSTHPAGS